MLSLIQRFNLEGTARFAASGQAIGGEHRLGLAVDAVPADGDWSHTMDAARAFGWPVTCAAMGCAGRTKPPMRVVLYNGYPGFRSRNRIESSPI